MRRKGSVLLGSLALILGLLLYLWRTHVQTLHLFIGESTAQALKDNDRPIGANRYDESPTIWPDNDLIGGTFQVSYGSGTNKILLPPARLVWMSQSAGVVYQLDISTSERKGTSAQIYKELSELDDQFRAAGWQQTSALPDLPSIQQMLESSSGNTSTLALAGYKEGNVEASLQLSAPGATLSPGSAAKASFVARIVIQDRVLEIQQDDRMFAEREKVNGSSQNPLPLSHWVK